MQRREDLGMLESPLKSEQKGTKKGWELSEIQVEFDLQLLHLRDLGLIPEEVENAWACRLRENLVLLQGDAALVPFVLCVSRACMSPVFFLDHIEIQGKKIPGAGRDLLDHWHSIRPVADVTPLYLLLGVGEDDLGAFLPNPTGDLYERSVVIQGIHEYRRDLKNQKRCSLECIETVTTISHLPGTFGIKGLSQSPVSPRQPPVLKSTRRISCLRSLFYPGFTTSPCLPHIVIGESNFVEGVSWEHRDLNFGSLSVKHRTLSCNMRLLA